ncbi:MAG: hypothetical protein WBG91_21095, partial [Syntrophobacteria bacterium]
LGGTPCTSYISPPFVSICVWYLAIMVGNSLLFASSHWLFTRPPLSTLLNRYVGRKRLEHYRIAFAGAARYPWK